MPPLPPDTPDTPDTSPAALLCPYCGHTQPATDRCVQCQGFLEPLSRKATQIAMGPWFVRDTTSPFRPGCSYETLKRQIETGRVTPASILRGPTTRQFWAVARQVPGVAHLLGLCHRCGIHVAPTDTACPRCGEAFPQVADQRNELGLQYPTPAAARAAQHELEHELARLSPAPALPAAPALPPGAGLLREVLSQPAPVANRPAPDAPTFSHLFDTPNHLRASAPPTTAADRRSSRLVWTLATINVVAVVAVTAWLLWLVASMG